MVRKGDILLVHNHFDPIGWVICLFTKSFWAHSAWCLSNTQVLEFKKSGMAVSPITKYLNKKIYKIKILRIKKIPLKDIKKAMEIAVREYDVGRNYLQFLLTLVLLGLGIKREAVVTCSGLIAKCLDKVGFQFKKNKDPLLITPADIDHSKFVKNITAKELPY